MHVELKSKLMKVFIDSKTKSIMIANKELFIMIKKVYSKGRHKTIRGMCLTK